MMSISLNLDYGKDNKGFTLIELLVILLIIALISGVTVLSMGDSTFRTIGQEAERFKLVVNSLADEAVYGSQEYGIVLSERSYQLLQFDIESASWLPMVDSSQQRHQVKEPVAMYWEIEGFEIEDDQPEQLRALLSDEAVGDEERILPHIMLFSSGEVTPFIVGFYSDTKNNDTHAKEVVSDGFGLARINQGG